MQHPSRHFRDAAKDAQTRIFLDWCYGREVLLEAQPERGCRNIRPSVKAIGKIKGPQRLCGLVVKELGRGLGDCYEAILATPEDQRLVTTFAVVDYGSDKVNLDDLDEAGFLLFEKHFIRPL